MTFKTLGSVALLSLLAGSLALAKSTPKHASKVSHSYIGVAAARKAALHAYPGHATSVKLENEEGKMQYAVMVKDKKAMHEVMVDAHTGRIASEEKVTAREEAQEAAAEAKADRARHARRK